MAQKLNTRTSIVDYLKSQNQDSSFSNRAILAKQHGINNYTGTAQQNIKLLNSLRNGGSGTVKEVSSAKKATASSVPKVNTVAKKATASSVPKVHTVKETSTTKPAPTVQAVPSSKMAQTDASLEKAMNNYREFLRSSSDAHFTEQKAMIQTSLEQQLNRLEKAYDEAVRQGKMSEEEATEQFEENVKAINEDAYINSQLTELSAQQRGIQNSQQMLAMQQGDQRHTQSLRDENRRARDKRVNDIKDRIAQITNEYNLDRHEANTTAELAIRQAQAQADQMFNTGMSQLNLMQYQSYLETKQNLTIQEQQHLYVLQQMAQQQQYTQDNMYLDQQFTQDNMHLNQRFTQDNMHLGQRFTQDNMRLNQQFTQDNMRLDQKFTQDNMRLNQQFTQDNMRLNQRFTQDNMNLQYKLDLGKMKTQHGYDMTKINTQFKNDLTKMSKQHGYNMSQLSAEQSNALARINAQMEANIYQAEEQRKAEQAALDRAYLDKTSSEYKVRTAQNEERSELVIQQSYSQAMGQAKGVYESEKWLEEQYKKDNPPAPPKKKSSEAWFNSITNRILNQNGA